MYGPSTALGGRRGAYYVERGVQYARQGKPEGNHSFSQLRGLLAYLCDRVIFRRSQLKDSEVNIFIACDDAGRTIPNHVDYRTPANNMMVGY